MTQAAKPAAETAAAQAAKPTQHDAAAAKEPVPQAELSIESIGWMFVQKYYASYTSDMSKLYGFYDSEAALSHDAFPSEIEDAGVRTKTVHVAQGTDAVRGFFEGQAASCSAAEKNKIVIENATFQASVDKSILIVVAGAWKRGSSSLWQFSQTFVLKAKGKTVYDVANDVLTFVDFSHESQGASKVNIVEAKPVAAETTSSTAPAENLETAPVQESKTATEAKPETASQETDVPEKSSATEAPETVESPKPVKDESSTSEANEAQEPTSSDVSIAETKDEPAATEAEEVEKPTEAPAPVTPAAPAQKPTWANLAAIGPKTTPKSSTVASPAVAKASAPPAVSPGLAAKKAVSPSQPSGQGVSNGKYKKEEWYPIFIRNVDVEEDELKAALVEQFGEMKYFKKTQKTALCDFKKKEDQQKALEQKEMVIKSNVISLEVRVHKAFNIKPDAKKDKKFVKKNGLKKN